MQVILARAGVASRREAERRIKAGEVTVNGKVVTELGTRADPLHDHIKVGGKLLPAPRFHEYLVFHKPVSCVTTMSDPEKRFCIGDVIEGLGKHLFPVGRLDFNTSGLLILTNDGELAQRLTHPSYHLEKRYMLKVDRAIEASALARLRDGIRLDGRPTEPAYVARDSSSRRRDWYEVRITEGRNQQIRRMFEAVGMRVEKLRRIAIGPLKLSSMTIGELRRLTDDEVMKLRVAVDLEV